MENKRKKLKKRGKNKKNSPLFLRIMNNQTNSELSIIIDIKTFLYVWESDLDIKKDLLFVTMAYVLELGKNIYRYI